VSPVGVTLVVPTVGRVDALSRCLAAVAAGTARPAEVVVVDQSSEGVALDAPLPVRTVRDDGRGLSRARNEGLRHATEPLVAFTDDDCVPEERWLAAAVSALEADPGLVAVAGPVLPLPDETGTLVAVSSRTSLESETFHRTREPWRVGSGGNLVVRTAVLRELGGFDVRLGAGSPGGAGEDVDVLHRLLRRGPVRYDAGVVVRHEQKPTAERRERRGRYGRGVGTAIGIWARSGDRTSAGVLAAWVALRLRLVVLDPHAAREELRVLGGTAAGLVAGLRA
jgi:GT2 family glycosyltransferase